MSINSLDRTHCKVRKIASIIVVLYGHEFLKEVFNLIMQFRSIIIFTVHKIC